MNNVTTAIVAVVIPLAVLEVGLLLYALVDLVRRSPQQINGEKWIWAIVIVAFSLLGPIVYLVAGRREA